MSANAGSRAARLRMTACSSSNWIFALISAFDRLIAEASDTPRECSRALPPTPPLDAPRPAPPAAPRPRPRPPRAEKRVKRGVPPAAAAARCLGAAAAAYRSDADADERACSSRRLPLPNHWTGSASHERAPAERGFSPLLVHSMYLRGSSSAGSKEGVGCVARDLGTRSRRGAPRVISVRAPVLEVAAARRVRAARVNVAPRLLIGHLPRLAVRTVAVLVRVAVALAALGRAPTVA